MKARRRIEEILKCVERASRVIKNVNGREVVLADIGADHGWVSHFAIARGFVQRCVCTDIHEKSLLKAKTLFDYNPDYKKKVEFRVGDGFEVFDHQVDKIDICVIAGMGGAEILKIIGENKKNAGDIRIFVLQARHDELFAGELSKYCGLGIVYDKVILDRGHVYRTIVAVDFANCTLQDNNVYDKLKIAFDEAVGKEISNLGIDFDIFGRNNLFDSSKEHLDAIEFLLELNKKLEKGLKSKNNTDQDIVEFVKTLSLRICQLEKIVAYIKEQKDKEIFYADERNDRVSKTRQ